MTVAIDGTACYVRYDARKSQYVLTDEWTGMVVDRFNSAYDVIEYTMERMEFNHASEALRDDDVLGALIALKTPAMKAAA